MGFKVSMRQITFTTIGKVFSIIGVQFLAGNYNFKNVYALMWMEKNHDQNKHMWMEKKLWLGQTHPCGTTRNHLAKIQRKVNPFLFFNLLNYDFYYWLAPHGLCVPHLCICYGKTINTCIGYTIKCTKSAHMQLSSE